ncbi:TonB-dependent receptor plug domain-containing protein [Aquirufa ecclesiirivi]|uniref:TonB-dependent receptor n=1 Tax=Aquirufa ecclesiirivi TaxID=2715124 RepID=UPI0022A87CBD|nr:carboxypeptidase-like regulatory domain-containing protein [Aquirufa ecclesiirivi]MCZ2471770.1 TonB-dependent receptor plug domain-containing protein [Aquirufa ecclesiirivi]
MKRLSPKFLPAILVMFLMSFSVLAQTKVGGQVSDAASKEALIGVSIAVKGKVIGTITDAKGNFSLSTSTPVPFTIVVSMVGYERQEIAISGNKTDLKINLKEQSVLGQDVVVSASRVEESVMKSPVSVEKMDIRSIRETPSASFYDALRNLKGVELVTQSVSFSSINMRGFGSNGNVRVVQMIDGMDNQAPGLNFSVGNIVGISELDLENVEVLPGASSALYGPNAMNGILLMNSKSPFLYQGLSAQVKGGFMDAPNRTVQNTPYSDISIRYAKAFNNKVAFKLNFNTLSAEDWQASDYRDQSLLNGRTLGLGGRSTNLAYNGVNIYGDETNVNMLSSLTPLLGDPTNPLTAGINQISRATGGLLSPSAILGYIVPNVNISREGYAERDLASYANRNMKFNAALHYRFNDKVELILQGSYGQGTTVYTGADRYSIKNFSMGQYKAELKGSNFFLRAYTTQENSGDAYATGTLGQLVNEAAKPSTSWYPQYFGVFATQALTNFGTVLGTTLAQTGNPTLAVGNAIATTQAAFNTYHNNARNTADVGRLIPGTAAFTNAVEAIKGKPLPQGARFLDKSALYHYEGMYNFTEMLDDKFEMLVGANYRVYALNSEGTLFARQDNGQEFSINEYGGYLQLAKKMFQDKFKLTGSMRYDKNENFEGQYSPRLSGVYTIGQSNFRASYQTGFRIPTTQDQYIDLNTPSARLLGGLPVVQDRYKLSGNSLTLQSVLSGKPEVYTAKAWKPEQVRTFEVGYKGNLGNNLLADFYYYQSTFTNFSAGQVVVQTPQQHKDNTVVGNKVFSFPSNVDNLVKTSGWGLSLDYRLPSNWTLGGNVSYNAVNDNGGLSNYQLAYNTPAYRTNITLGNRNIGGSGWGFSTVWRYQDEYVWQSSFVNQILNQTQQSVIPSFSTLDAQVSKKLASIKSIVKVGASNILGTAYTTGWGNPTVGSIYYVSITFDELLNK